MRSIVLYFTAFIAVIAIIPLAHSSTEEIDYNREQVIVPLDGSYIYAGKKISYHSPFTYGEFYVDVDKDYKLIKQGIRTDVGGIELLPLSYLKKGDDYYLLVNVTTTFVCKNAVCEDTESSYSCCTDCGCPSEEECIENVCVNPSENSCNDNSDCNDNLSSTTDICAGVPRECLHNEITECVRDDGFCPEGCNEMTDNDCIPKPECVKDSDCDDKDNSTINICSKVTRKCYFEAIPEHIEVSSNKCDSDSDCPDEGCTIGRCSDLGICYNIEQNGCDFKGSCLIEGGSIGNKICSGGKIRDIDVNEWHIPLLVLSGVLIILIFLYISKNLIPKIEG